MPRSRSISIVSSTCSRISRASSPPQVWISRSARVDLPWSIWAMIAKLRIWLSGVVMMFQRVPPEHKDAAAPDQRDVGLIAVPSEFRVRNAEFRRRRLQVFVITAKLQRAVLSVQILRRRKMQPIQRADGNRKRRQCSRQNQARHLHHIDQRQQVARILAKRVGQSVSVYPVPDLVLEQSAGDQM